MRTVGSAGGGENGIESGEPKIRDQRQAGDQHAQIRGQHRPDDRRDDAGKQEGRAPDCGERDEPPEIGGPHFFAGFSSSRSRFFRAMPQA